MEIKNIEELKAAYPDLMEQARAEAFDAGKADGVAAERERLQGIESIENSIQDKDLIYDAKYGDAPLNAEQLAFKALQKQSALGVTMLQDLKQDIEDSGVNGVAANPEPPQMSAEEKAASEEKAALDAVKNVLYPKGVR